MISSFTVYSIMSKIKPLKTNAVAVRSDVFDIKAYCNVH